MSITFIQSDELCPVSFTLNPSLQMTQTNNTACFLSDFLHIRKGIKTMNPKPKKYFCSQFLETYWQMFHPVQVLSSNMPSHDIFSQFLQCILNSSISSNWSYLYLPLHSISVLPSHWSDYMVAGSLCAVWILWLQI